MGSDSSLRTLFLGSQTIFRAVFLTHAPNCTCAFILIYCHSNLKNVILDETTFRHNFASLIYFIIPPGVVPLRQYSRFYTSV